MIGVMINYATWEKYIRASQGSEPMKESLIDFVRAELREGELLDSFKLGYALGWFSRDMHGEALRDFYATIELTRDTRNVPIVRTPEGSVS